MQELPAFLERLRAVGDRTDREALAVALEPRASLRRLHTVVAVKQRAGEVGAVDRPREIIQLGLEPGGEL